MSILKLKSYHLSWWRHGAGVNFLDDVVTERWYQRDHTAKFGADIILSDQVITDDVTSNKRDIKHFMRPLKHGSMKSSYGQW